MRWLAVPLTTSTLIAASVIAVGLIVAGLVVARLVAATAIAARPVRTRIGRTIPRRLSAPVATLLLPAVTARVPASSPRWWLPTVHLSRNAVHAGPIRTRAARRPSLG